MLVSIHVTIPPVPAPTISRVVRPSISARGQDVGIEILNMVFNRTGMRGRNGNAGTGMRGRNAGTGDGMRGRTGLTHFLQRDHSQREQLGAPVFDFPRSYSPKIFTATL